MPTTTTNPVIAFPAGKPELKLANAADRAEAAATASQAAERHHLDQDREEMRDREANLRDYEARLRAWQTQIENGLQQSEAAHYIAPIAQARLPSIPPFEGDAALKAGWEKLIRARELLEAEQAHVRDDRLNLKETAALLKRHESALIAREDSLAQREELLAAATAAQVVEANKPSTITRLTKAPFAIAKSVFGSKSPLQE